MNSNQHNHQEEEEEKEPQPHLLSVEIKHAIVNAKKRGLSNTAAAKEVAGLYDRPSLSHKTVKDVYNKYLTNGDVENQWNMLGRPTILDEEEREEVLEYAENNRKASCKDIVRELDLVVSRRTVNRILTKDGLKAYRAPKKFLITPANILERLKFAESHRRWDIEEWKKIVFSDESLFGLINSSGRIFVRRREGEAHREDTVQPHAKKTPMVMVWGAISFAGVGPLFRVEGTLKGDYYLEILRTRLPYHFPDLFGGELIFQQDNATPHKKTNVKEWLENRDVKTLEWPAQSPDLNVIEDVWNHLKYQMAGKVYEDLDEVWEELKVLWKKIPVDFIQDLYQSLPRRVQALHRAKGKNTKY